MKKWIESSIAVVCIIMITACSGGGNKSPENSVVGKWKTQKSAVEKGGNVEMTINLDLKADKTMSMNVDAAMNGEQKGLKIRIPMKMGFNGKWDASADKMIWIPDSSSMNISIDKDSIIIDTPNSKVNDLINLIKDALVDELQKQQKPFKAFNFNMKDSMNYFIENSQLVIVSDLDSLRFDKN